jgi:hypothetical protein
MDLDGSLNRQEIKRFLKVTQPELDKAEVYILLPSFLPALPCLCLFFCLCLCLYLCLVFPLCSTTASVVSVLSPVSALPLPSLRFPSLQRKKLSKDILKRFDYTPLMLRINMFFTLNAMDMLVSLLLQEIMFYLIKET